jgi:hypothetical protein
MRWVAAATGVVCGYLSSSPLAGLTWWNLLLWIAAGIALGFFVREPREARFVGLVYGVFLGLSFLLLIFGGTPDTLPVYLLFTALLTVVSALCGWLAVYIGSLFGKIR